MFKYQLPTLKAQKWIIICKLFKKTGCNMVKYIFAGCRPGALRLGRRSHAGGHRRDDLAVPGQHLLGGAVRFLAAGAGDKA